MSKWLSRKFLTMILGTILTGLLIRFGMAPEEVTKIVALLVSYILGQSAVDAAAARTATPVAAAIAGSEPVAVVATVAKGKVPDA